MNRSKKLIEKRNQYIVKVLENSQSTTRAARVLSQRLYLSERRIWGIFTETTEKNT